jgi:hypothetical protein
MIPSLLPVPRDLAVLRNVKETIMKTVTVVLWAALAMLAGAALDAFVTLFVFKAAGGCPYMSGDKAKIQFRNVLAKKEVECGAGENSSIAS